VMPNSFMLKVYPLALGPCSTASFPRPPVRTCTHTGCFPTWQETHRGQLHYRHSRRGHRLGGCVDRLHQLFSVCAPSWPLRVWVRSCSTNGREEINTKAIKKLPWLDSSYSRVRVTPNFMATLSAASSAMWEWYLSLDVSLPLSRSEISERSQAIGRCGFS
jgi:hypothetical protein